MHCFCGNKDATSPSNTNLQHNKDCTNLKGTGTTGTINAAPVIFHKEPIIRETAAQVIEQPAKIINHAPVTVSKETFITEQPIITKEQVVTKQQTIENRPLVYEKQHILEQQPITERQPIIEKQNIVSNQPMVVDKQQQVVTKPGQTIEKQPIIVNHGTKVLEKQPLANSNQTLLNKDSGLHGDLNRTGLTNTGFDQHSTTGSTFDKTNLHSDSNVLDKERLEARTGQINSSRV